MRFVAPRNPRNEADARNREECQRQVIYCGLSIAMWLSPIIESSMDIHKDYAPRKRALKGNCIPAINELSVNRGCRSEIRDRGKITRNLCLSMFC